MSELLKTILLTPSGGAAKLEYKKTANIFGIGHVCSSVPFEELTISLTSAVALSTSEVKLVASPATAGVSLNTIQNPKLVASPASAYSLSTALT